jgi:hypothetical protein
LVSIEYNSKELDNCEMPIPEEDQIDEDEEGDTRMRGLSPTKVIK